MKITNKLGLPESFVMYASKSDYGYKENRYSVTELLLPTREIILNRKYADEIETDVADSIPALFGTAVHNVLEANTPLLKGLLTEQSIECQFGEDTVSGRIDLLDMNNLEITDYKTSSVSKVMREDFNDFKLQGLAYAYMVYQRLGIIIKRLKFPCLLKDWSKIKSASSSNYPSSAIYIWKYEVQESDLDFIEGYIKDKLKSIHDAETELPECTDEERWYTGTKYAVFRNAGDKRAAIVCDSEEEAHGYITNKYDGAGEIEVRKGEYLKCKYYCNCCKFCKEGGE